MSRLRPCGDRPILQRENASDIVKELRYIRNILERLETNKRIISENTSDNEPQNNQP